MKNPVTLLGITENTDNNFPLDAKNIEDFLKHYKDRFAEETNETSIIICSWFRSPVIHTSDMHSFGLDSKEMKLFLQENDIETSFQGVNAFALEEHHEQDFHERYAALRDLANDTVRCGEARDKLALHHQALEGTLPFTFAPTFKREVRHQVLAGIFLDLQKRYLEKLSTKMSEHNGIYDNVFVLVPTFDAILLKRQHPKSTLHILESSLLFETYSYQFQREMLIRDVLPHRLAQKTQTKV